MIKRMSGNKREYGYPIMKANNNYLCSPIIESKGKAELLARTFVKIHNSNLSNEEKIQREKTIRNSVEVIQDGGDNESTINVMFTVGELNNVLRKSGKTTPENDHISYCMIKNVNDESKETLLKLYNKVFAETVERINYCSYIVGRSKSRDRIEYKVFSGKWNSSREYS